MNNALSKIDESLANIEFAEVLEKMAYGETYQDMLQISNEEMQSYYSVAIEYFKNHQYAEAADCFLFLCALNPLKSNLWLRLGNAEHSLQHDEDALEAYAMATLLDANDPFPHLYAAEIYQRQNKTHESEECLNICITLIDQEPKFESLRKSVLQMRQRLNHRGSL